MRARCTSLPCLTVVLSPTNVCQAKILGLQEQVAEAKAEAATWRKRDEEQRAQLAAHDGCAARLGAAKTTATDCKARLADALADGTESRRAHERCSETLARALSQRDAAQRQLDVARGQLKELEAAKEQLRSAAEEMRRAAQTEAAALRASQGNVSRADAAEHRVHELEEAGAAAKARGADAKKDAALVPGLREALQRAEAVRHLQGAGWRGAIGSGSHRGLLSEQMAREEGAKRLVAEERLREVQDQSVARDAHAAAIADLKQRLAAAVQAATDNEQSAARFRAEAEQLRASLDDEHRAADGLRRTLANVQARAEESQQRVGVLEADVDKLPRLQRQLADAADVSGRPTLLQHTCRCLALTVLCVGGVAPPGGSNRPAPRQGTAAAGCRPSRAACAV